MLPSLEIDFSKNVKLEIIVGFVNKKYDIATGCSVFLRFFFVLFCFSIGGFVAAAAAKPQATQWRNHIHFDIEPALAKESFVLPSEV